VTQRKIYLDHAATSWPKPPGVLEACIEFQTQLGVAASRGAYYRSERTDRIIADVRESLANFLGIADPTQIAWTSNGTMAIHAAIHSLLWQTQLQDHHVVTTATEHNSVLRTLADLEHRRGLRWTLVPCDQRGWVDPESIRSAIEPKTRLVIVNHASNVTGMVQDLTSIARIVGESDAWLMVDAAQSIGFMEFDPESLGIDLLVAPTHKGLCGMLGTAFIAASPRVTPHLKSPWIGGTGRSSIDWNGPFGWRESIESGNLNGPSIASLGAGLNFLNSNSTAQFKEKLDGWLRRILKEIQDCKNLALVGYPNSSSQFDDSQRVPLVSFSSQSLTSHEMAMLLDSALGVECRSGLHCAGAIHHHLGSDPQNGTLRMSFGHTTAESDVEMAIEGIRLLDQVAL
jgi:selenocysteine lyase/cysteine desulfurase